MSIFSYHLVEVPFWSAVGKILSSPVKKSTKGLIHAEYMSAMTLGSPIFSRSRVLIGQNAIFMQWESEEDLENYLHQDKFGKVLAKGWHVRLKFVREWGAFTGLKLPESRAELSNEDVAVAVTIARMKPWAVPRFIRWGRPVEKLVRDHPGTTISLASVKFLNTVSTFSIWKSVDEMTSMVRGHSNVERPKRHADAMKERDRKDFHFEFTTLRFKPIGEYGEWKKQSNFTANHKQSS